MLNNLATVDVAVDERAARSLRRTHGPSDTKRSPTGASEPARNGVACVACGQLARVHILHDYARGAPVYQRLCLDCALHAAAPLPSVPHRWRGTVVAVLIAVGLGSVSLVADALIPNSVPGFGWIQRAGVAAGALLVVVGTFMRVDVIALAGIFLFGSALAKDWFDPTPGFGWKQQLVLAASAACLVYGVGGRLAARHLRAWLQGAPARPPAQPACRTLELG
ncbi:MAG: hypothetical protein AB1716_00760 [Planctomycetota bacterium]